MLRDLGHWRQQFADKGWREIGPCESGPAGPTYKYDVALSFLQLDEPLATKLGDLLAGRLRTFLYTRQQGEIAGTDGEQTLNRVFGSEARIVVVLYREEWGKTPFTRIEETAIRNRGYEEGYDFALFIMLETPRGAPRWLPRARLWIGLDRWGFEAAAGVIDDVEHARHAVGMGSSLGPDAKDSAAATRSSGLPQKARSRCASHGYS